jgi:hypothetical protein
MAGQTEQAQPETRHDVAEAKRPQSEPLDGQLLSETVQRRVAQAIQPVLADVQGRVAALVQEHLRNELRNHPLLAGDARSLLSEDGTTVAFPVFVNADRAEDVLHMGIAAAVDLLFSDRLRSIVEEQAKSSAQSLVTATRTALPEDADREKLQQRADRELDKMLDELFSRSMRDKARRRGERVVRELIRSDIPSAREEAERGLQSFLEEWNAVTFQHWERVSRTVVKAVADAASSPKESEKRETTQAASREQPAEEDIPQTILRSDKRAQEIWTKARDEAASDGGEERTGARAAYEALKQEYEKQGDHWVKKKRSR